MDRFQNEKRYKNGSSILSSAKKKILLWLEIENFFATSQAFEIKMRTKVWKGGFSVFGWIYDIQKYGKQQLCYFPFQQNIEAFTYGNKKNRFRMALKILLKGFYAGLSLGNNVFYAISSGVGFLCYIAFAFSWWISLLFYSSSISKWHHTSYLSEIFFVFVKIKKKNVQEF